MHIIFKSHVWRQISQGLSQVMYSILKKTVLFRNEQSTLTHNQTQQSNV